MMVGGQIEPGPHTHPLRCKDTIILQIGLLLVTPQGGHLRRLQSQGYQGLPAGVTEAEIERPEYEPGEEELRDWYHSIDPNGV